MPMGLDALPGSPGGAEPGRLAAHPRRGPRQDILRAARALWKEHDGSVTARPPEPRRRGRDPLEDLPARQSSTRIAGRTDDCISRPDAFEKASARPSPTPVMRDLQHIGPEPAALLPEETLLDLGVDVGHEEKRSSGQTDSQHEGPRIPGPGKTGARRLRGPRPERLDREIAAALDAGVRAPPGDRRAARPSPLRERLHRGLSTAPFWQPELTDLERVEHSERTAAMIEIGMRHHEQIERTASDGGETPDEGRPPGSIRRARSGIDQHRARASLDQRGIALPDIEEPDARPIREVTAVRPRQPRHGDQDCPAQQGRTKRPGPQTEQPDPREEDRREPGAGGSRRDQRRRRQMIGSPVDRPRHRLGRPDPQSQSRLEPGERMSRPEPDAQLRKSRQRRRPERGRQDHERRPGDRQQIAGRRQPGQGETAQHEQGPRPEPRRTGASQRHAQTGADPLEPCPRLDPRTRTRSVSGS